MFESILSVNERQAKAVPKWLTFSLSFFFHALAIGGVVIVPLIYAESRLPELKVISAALKIPQIPGVPPAGKPAAKGVNAGPVKKDPNKSSPRQGGFVAPVDIPTTLTEEDPTTLVGPIEETEGVEGGDGASHESWKIAPDFSDDLANQEAQRITSIQKPRLVKLVKPEYPENARLARIPGVVVVEASTDIFGRVKGVRVVSGHPLFHDAALAAIRQWVYDPYIINGVPRPVIFTVTITFSLEGN